MPNMQNNKTPMPELSPAKRITCFDEVALGYSEEDALNEAARCLGCKHKPCVSGCPVGVHIPDFIAQIAKGNYEEAFKIISETNSLPGVCGRVCPQEMQCEAKCVRGIKGEPVGIGRLERFAADWHRMHVDKEVKKDIKPNGKKVAVIGGGPAGLTCAGALRAKGYEVTVYEAFHTAGGVLMYGIPQFRLPKEIVSREIDELTAQGVDIRTNMVIGKVLSVEELQQAYDAIFIGTGAGLPSFLNIPGEELMGVYSANEYLTRINLMKAYRDDYDTPIKRTKCAAVVGGGNVAMDAVRCAKRLGAEHAYIIYRRSEKEMPARQEEIHHAKEEGVEFMLLCAPVKIIGDENGRVKGLECIRMQLGEPDESGRRRPEKIEGSEFILEADTVISAIGNTPNPLIRSTTKGLETNKKGCIIVDQETLETSIRHIYAGGDVVSGAATVILAMGAGKQAALSIDKALSGK